MVIQQKEKISDTSLENLSIENLGNLENISNSFKTLHNSNVEGVMAPTGSNLKFNLKKFLENNSKSGLLPKGLCYFHLPSNPAVLHCSVLLETNAYPGSNDKVGPPDLGKPKKFNYKRKKKY